MTQKMNDTLSKLNPKLQQKWQDFWQASKQNRETIAILKSDKRVLEEALKSHYTKLRKTSDDATRLGLQGEIATLQSELKKTNTLIQNNRTAIHALLHSSFPTVAQTAILADQINKSYDADFDERYQEQVLDALAGTDISNESTLVPEQISSDTQDTSAADAAQSPDVNAAVNASHKTTEDIIVTEAPNGSRKAEAFNAQTGEKAAISREHIDNWREHLTNDIREDYS